MKFPYLIIFALALVPFSGHGSSESPEGFLKNCFKSYLDAFSLPAKASQKMSAEVRNQCLSKQFLAKWDKLVSMDGTGADGLLLAQDSLESWRTDITVQKPNKTDNSAEVVLGKASERHCLFVKYVRLDSGFRISSVSQCPK